MFDLKKEVANWRRQMAAGEINSESLQELEAHLRDDIEHSVRAGLGESQAFEEAVRRLGGAPALRSEFAKERTTNYRRLVFFGLAISLGMGAVSVALCQLVVIPAAVAASEAYARWLGFTTLQWNADVHVRFALRCMAGVGFGFEIPVVLLTLVKARIVDYRLLSRARKYAIVINLVLGAVFTGPELITQLIMFLPLQAVYELCVWTAWFWDVRSKRSGTAG